MEIQRLEDCRLGVVPEAAPPVQTLWQIAALCAHFCKNINIFAKTWCIYTSLVSNESLHIALYYCMTLTDVWPYTCTLWTDLMPIIGKNRQFRYLISDRFLLWNQAYFSQTSDVLCASSCKMLNNNSEPIKLNSYESSDCFREFSTCFHWIYHYIDTKGW